MTRSPSYLAQNQYGYLFRMRVPHDLKNWLGKNELKRSLKTGYLPQARSRAMILGGRYKQLFRWARYQTIMGKMTENEIQELVALVVDYIGDADLYGIEGMTMDARSFSPEDLRDKINKAKDAVLHYKHAADSGDYSGGIRVDLIVDEIIEHLVESPPVKGSPEYKLLCRKAADALRDKWDAYQKHHTERLAGVFNAVSDGAFLQQKNQETESAVDFEPSITLQALITEYQNERIKAGLWKKSTVKDYNAKFNAMLQFFGDVPVKTITRQQAVEYKKLLNSLPPGFGRMKDYRDISGLTSDSLVGKHDHQLDLATLKNYIQMVSAVFNFAVRNGYMEKNPAEGLQPPKKKQARQQRQPFDESDLQKLFHARQYVKDKHAKSYQFWLPILGLYTGCRLKELCQLYVEDVTQIDGIWCLDINGDKDKELKNESSERVVPLHPVLVDVLAFPGFVRKVKHAGQERVFGDLKKQNGDYGHYASKWFATYKGKAGIDTTPNKKVFHSFRHNFADALFKNMVMETVIEELTGRAGKTETSRRYAKGYNIKDLFEVVSGKLDYPVDLSHLKKSRFVIK